MLTSFIPIPNLETLIDLICTAVTTQETESVGHVFPDGIARPPTLPESLRAILCRSLNVHTDDWNGHSVAKAWLALAQGQIVTDYRPHLLVTFCGAYPQLAVHEFGSVQPISGPDTLVHFLDTVRVGGYGESNPLTTVLLSRPISSEIDTLRTPFIDPLPGLDMQVELGNATAREIALELNVYFLDKLLQQAPRIKPTRSDLWGKVGEAANRIFISCCGEPTHVILGAAACSIIYREESFASLSLPSNLPTIPGLQRLKPPNSLPHLANAKFYFAPQWWGNPAAAAVLLLRRGHHPYDVPAIWSPERLSYGDPHPETALTVHSATHVVPSHLAVVDLS